MAGPVIVSASPADSAIPTATVNLSTASHLPGVFLRGVSCVSTSDCFAVGDAIYGAQGSTEKTLTERWNGTGWSIVPSANQAGSAISELDGVSCVSATFCVAVGFSQPNMATPGDALVEQWNGRTWSIVERPVGVLQGVSCTSATFCIAVGGGSLQRWNGKTWSITKNPPQFGAAVSCTSAMNCFAVNAEGGAGSFVARWNGKTWAIVPSPQTPGLSFDNYWGLSGVSCASINSCQGVGTLVCGVLCFLSFAEAWNGSIWSVVTIPEPKRSGGTILNGVACPGATNCTAVGVYGFGEFPFNVPRAFAEHWNGNTWTPFAVPEPKNSYGSFAAVSCPSPTTCFAVGESWPVLGGRIGYTGYLGQPKTAVEQWNGTSWSIVGSPNPA